MTLYSTDLTALLKTVNETLINRVLPALDDGTARLELGGVTELVANLIDRVAWDAERSGQTSDRTEVLAAELRTTLGFGNSAASPTLRQGRLAVSDLLARAYDDPERVNEIVDAVSRFTDADVDDQISVGLRNGLPR